MDIEWYKKALGQAFLTLQSGSDSATQSTPATAKKGLATTAATSPKITSSPSSTALQGTAVKKEDFEQQVRLSFPNPEKQSTFSFSSNTIGLKDYAPKIFQQLRHFFRLKEQDYWQSVRDANYINMGKLGKSGAFLFSTTDRLYIIKTLKKEDAKFIRSMLQDYYNHMKDYCTTTLLLRICGLHRIEVFKGRLLYFCVTLCVYPPVYYHLGENLELYDLKGCSVGRSAKGAKGRDSKNLNSNDSTNNSSKQEKGAAAGTNNGDSSDVEYSFVIKAKRQSINPNTLQQLQSDHAGTPNSPHMNGGFKESKPASPPMPTTKSVASPQKPTATTLWSTATNRSTSTPAAAATTPTGYSSGSVKNAINQFNKNSSNSNAVNNNNNNLTRGTSTSSFTTNSTHTKPVPDAPSPYTRSRNNAVVSNDNNMVRPSSVPSTLTRTTSAPLATTKYAPPKPSNPKPALSTATTTSASTTSDTQLDRRRATWSLKQLDLLDDKNDDDTETPRRGTAENNVIFKDLDLQRRLRIGIDNKRRLLAQIKIDCKFLEQHSIMDYSLLVGVHTTTKARRASAFSSSPSSIPSTIVIHQRNSTSPSQQQQQQGWVGTKSLINIFEDKSHATTTDSSKEAPLPKPDWSFRDIYCCFDVAAEPSSSPSPSPSSYGRSTAQNDNSVCEVLYFGIIDITQQYNLRKRGESMLKSIVYEGDQISTVNPVFYSSRFQKFLKMVFE